MGIMIPRCSLDCRCCLEPRDMDVEMDTVMGDANNVLESAGFMSSLDSHLVLHVLSYLDPIDLAKLEATSSAFRLPTNLHPDNRLGFAELAAKIVCETRSLIRKMNEDDKEKLKQRCGGSWKLVLRYVNVGECIRRHGCPDVVAGAGHSVVLTKLGAVYTFGANNAGQLGHPMQTELWKPRLIWPLQQERVVQAAAGVDRTMLVTDMGRVYAFGRSSFNEEPFPTSASKDIVHPELVKSLHGISVVQVSLGHFFTAVLSQEGQVYTLSWGSDEKLGHRCKPHDREAHLLTGTLTDVPVVQIAAGNCFLLALAYEPGGMSVYSVGCGQGGKLGNGHTDSLKKPVRIEFPQGSSFKPVAIAAGPWHAVALSEDGRVCTWGWATGGCLGVEPLPTQNTCRVRPTLVEALADHVKIVHIASGFYATFAFADNGDAYCFGQTSQVQEENTVSPKLITTFKERGEEVVRISKTNTVAPDIHTLALMASGKVYASGSGADGQLGRELPNGQRSSPIVEIDFKFD